MAAELPQVDETLAQLIKRESYAFNFVVSDAREKDCPIVFASEGFYQLTGYSPDEVLGRNCRFLQGAATQRNKVCAIRDAIREERSCSVVLVNYTKAGRPFHNLFHLAPVLSDDGNVLYYVGCQTEVGGELPGAQAALQAASQAASLTSLLLKHCGAGGAKAALAAPVVMPRHPSSAHCVPSALVRALVRVQQSFCLSDPSQPDCPIVHCSQAFLDMTGYSAEEVIGRNCRFLQGPATDRAAVARLREGIAAGEAVTVLLLNYSKQGEPFWNSVHVAPVRDASGAIVLYVGVQLDCTLRVPESPPPPGRAPQLPPHLASAPLEPTGVPAAVAQLGAVGAVRVAVRGLKTDGLKRHGAGVA